MDKGCMYIGQTAIYNGPFKSVEDDDGHVYERGVPLEICTDTAKKLSKPPFNGVFKITGPTAKSGRRCDPEVEFVKFRL